MRLHYHLLLLSDARPSTHVEGNDEDSCEGEEDNRPNLDRLLKAIFEHPEERADHEGQCPADDPNHEDGV